MKEYRGSKIVPVRIDNELLQQLKDTLARLEHRRPNEPYTTSSFIRQAIVDKIKHYARSSKKRNTSHQ